MRTRKGMILLQVLVMVAVFMAICASLVTACMQGMMLRKKSITKEEAASGMEGTAAKMWACLNDAGYPPAGSCKPTGPQRACVPAGTNVDFTGTYPACRIRINLEK